MISPKNSVIHICMTMKKLNNMKKILYLIIYDGYRKKTLPNIKYAKHFSSK